MVVELLLETFRLNSGYFFPAFAAAKYFTISGKKVGRFHYLCQTSN
jgi:hypothetical protein